MQRPFLSLSLVAAVALAGCKTVPPPASAGYHAPCPFTVSGVVHHLGSGTGGWGIRTVAGAQFIPANLPPAFRQDGLAVRITAREKPRTSDQPVNGTVIDLWDIARQ